MNEYIATIETEHDNGDIVRDFVEYNALSSSEAQAYAFDELAHGETEEAIATIEQARSLLENLGVDA
jgi:hypothetical protein